jgi:hypothetical protein
MDGLLPDDGDQAILGSSMSGERLNRLLFGLHCDAKTTTGRPCSKGKKMQSRLKYSLLHNSYIGRICLVAS